MRTVSLALLVLATCVVYANSFRGAFLFDDHVNIQESPRIQSLWPPVWLGGQRPVVNLSLAVNRALGDDAVWGYHLFNLIIHVLAGLVLFGIVRRGAMCLGKTSTADVFAFAVALLWMLHPLQTQSVTYIIQRAEALMGLFYLLTLYAALRSAEAGARSGQVAWTVVALFAFVLGMNAKPVAVTVPLAVLLLDRAVIYRKFRAAWSRRKLLYVGLAVLLVGLVFGTRLRGMLFANGSGERVVGVGAAGISAWDYLCTQAEVIAHYLKLAVFPRTLVIDYNWPIAHGVGGVAPQAMLLIALIVGAIVAWRYRPWVGFAGLWLFITLAPTSSIIPIVDPAFEHRMYLPLAGVIVLVVAGVFGLLRTLRRRFGMAPKASTFIGAVLLLAVAVSFGARTVARNADYHDPIVLWGRNARDCPQNPRAHNNLCQALNDTGRNHDALVACDAALALTPDYADALANRGSVLLDLGQPREAAASCRRALTVDADQSAAHVTLGYALMLLGDNVGAVEHARAALIREPRNTTAINNLGNALLRLGKTDEAMATFQQALAIDPRRADTYNNLALVHAERGDLPGAAAAFERALILSPDLFAAQVNLATIYERMQRIEDARTAYRRALVIAQSEGNAAQVSSIQARLARLDAP